MLRYKLLYFQLNTPHIRTKNNGRPSTVQGIAGEASRAKWEWTDSVSQPWEKHSLQLSASSVNARALSPVGRKQMLRFTRSEPAPPIDADEPPPPLLAGTSVDLLRDRHALGTLTRQFRWSAKRVELKHLYDAPPLPGDAVFNQPAERQLPPPVLIPCPTELQYKVMFTNTQC